MQVSTLTQLLGKLRSMGGCAAHSHLYNHVATADACSQSQLHAQLVTSYTSRWDSSGASKRWLLSLARLMESGLKLPKL